MTADDFDKRPRRAGGRALEERACGGLLIREAYYGDVAAARAAAADGGGGDGDESDEGGSGGRGLDVRIALQHAVVDSALRLPAASKAGLRGFAPVEGDAPRFAPSPLAGGTWFVRRPVL